MARYVQINTVPHGSTGSVMFRTQAERLAAGDECWAMWGRGRAAANDHELKFGTAMGVRLDAVMTRIDDRAGFHSKAATRRLLAKLDEIRPDVVHLHNLHGYYLNIEMLFAWLAARGCQVRWTLHDCWPFTGHCAHFTAAGCEQWKTGCACLCPQRRSYPASLVRDACTRNHRDKKRLFTSLPPERLTLITPSQWLADLVGLSFMAAYPVEVVRNEVDRNVFKPEQSDVRERLGIGGRFMVLGVASPWTPSKGMDDFIRLSECLGDRCAIVMAGLSRAQIAALPPGVIGLERIEDACEMARLYTAADLLFNPSKEETFGLTIAEAAACGTRVLVYAGGACEETARLLSQEIVPDFEAAVRAIAAWAGRQ